MGTRGATSGIALRGVDIPERVRHRLRERVRKTPDCWLWTGATNPDGYGLIGWSSDGRFELHLTHRVAYVLQYGDIPAGMVVRSTCSQRSCVRHLELTTHAENMAQSVRRQRSGMNMALAQSIRDRVRAGETDEDIAADLDLSRRRVARIRLNQVWTDPAYQPVGPNLDSSPPGRLTTANVREARERNVAGESINALAQHYGVSYSTMWDAVRGESWAHVRSA